MKYKNYIFDLYGTLIRIHTNENKPVMWKVLTDYYNSYGCHYSVTKLHQCYLDTVKQYQFFQQTISKQHDIDIDICDVFVALLKNKVEIRDDFNVQQFANDTATLFRILSREIILLYPDVIHVLNALKQKDCKLYLLSNAQAAFTYSELLQCNLLELFDDIYISSQYKMAKPNPLFLKQLIDDKKLDVKECVFIGNEVGSDIKVADLNHMDSILYNSNHLSNKQIEKLLNEYHIVNKPTVIKKYKELMEI